MAKAKEEKKKKGPMIKVDAKGSRAERMASVVAGANKAFKMSIIHSADEESFMVVPRASTGLYGLDAALNGGLPIGRMSMVYGPEGSGKTNLYLRGVADAQERCANCYQYGEFEDGILEMPDFEKGGVKAVKTRVISSCPCGDPRDMVVLWNDAENVWTTPWARKLGVKAEKVMVVKPTYGEQAYDLISSFVSMKDIDVIVIDSIAQLTPAAEMEASMGEQFQGIAARMNNRFLRKLISGMCEAFNAGRPITLWAVNQYRQKIGVIFGSNETIPGGMGQRFATSVEIECRKGKVSLEDETNEPIFGEFSWRVKKNKVGVEGGKGGYQQCMMDTDLFVVGDLMEHEFVIAKAVELGFVSHPNSVMYEYDGQSFRGKSVLVRYLGENPRLYHELKTKMLRVKLGLSDGEN